MIGVDDAIASAIAMALEKLIEAAIALIGQDAVHAVIDKQMAAVLAAADAEATAKFPPPPPTTPTGTAP